MQFDIIYVKLLKEQMSILVLFDWSRLILDAILFIELLVYNIKLIYISKTVQFLLLVISTYYTNEDVLSS